MKRVLEGLVVRPDVMMKEIIDSCGCYAASVAKERLEELGASEHLTSEDCYRIIQLAAFNAMQPRESMKTYRDAIANSFDEATAWYSTIIGTHVACPPPNINTIIQRGELRPDPTIEATDEEVERLNAALIRIFSEQDAVKVWVQVFSFDYLLRNEHILYKEILR